MGALKENNIIRFPIRVMDGGKKIRNNTDKEITPKWVDPIKGNDINKVNAYLQHELEIANTSFRRKIAARNQLIWILGTYSGFRVSDLETMKWRLFFDKNGELLDGYSIIQERKTGKMRELKLITAIKNAIKEYVAIVQPDISKRDDYVFWGRTVLYEIYNIGGNYNKIIDDVEMDVTKSEADYEKVDHRGLNEFQLKEKTTYLDEMRISYTIRRFHLTDAGIRKIVKKITKECSIKGNFGSRSLRKTYACKIYDEAVERGATAMEAAVKVQKDLQHCNIETTISYIRLKLEDDMEFLEAAMSRGEIGVSNNKELEEIK